MEDLEISSYVLVNKVVQYFESNGMVVNPNKTNFIKFNLTNNRHNQNLNLFVGENQINQVNSTKFLGVYIDSQLNWNEHIEKLAATLSSNLFLIKKISQLGCKKLTTTCYYSFFYSHIKYSVLLWGLSSHQNMERIFKLQKRAIRIIENLNYSESCKNSFISNNMLTVPSIFIEEAIMYANQNNLLDINKNHHYNTRQLYNFSAQHRLKIFEEKPSYVGQKFFQKLPLELKNKVNLISFKKYLREWLLAKSYYSIPEFLSE